jgi:hypothetical protein
MSEAKTKTLKEPALKSKRERRPINGNVTRLEVRGKEEGFHYAWINEGNVDAALDAGYEFVRHEVQVGRKHIDTTNFTMESQIWFNVGKGVKAFLMRQPQEFYDEDQALEQRIADEQTAARLGEIDSGGLSEINVSTSLGKR